MSSNSNSRLRWLLTGTIFAALWPSASTATKIALVSAQPLVIAVIRFGVAALIMLFIAHVLMRQRLPAGRREWTQLAIYGVLNITIYLGCYVLAMQYVTAGIGSLAVAVNPVLISFLSVFLLKKKLTWPIIGALCICTVGVICAAWPLFGDASVTGHGLAILFFSMFSYSIAAIYFSARNWNGLSLFVINGWQTLLGGLFLLPFTLALYRDERNHFTLPVWASIAWLAIPVSIVAVQLWLWLLRANPVRAGLWLFLCPLFGFLFAAWWMKDAISVFTVTGVALVLAGLWLSKLSPEIKNSRESFTKE